MIERTLLRTGLLMAVSLVAMAPAAMAQDDALTRFPQARGFYLEGAAGASWTEDTSSTTRSVTSRGGTVRGPLNFTTSYDTGYAAGGRFGYGFENGLRLEEEAMYRRQSLSSTKVSGPNISGTPTLSSISGKNESVAVMTNILYDFQNSSRFTPYVGVGGGALYVQQTLNASGTTPGGVGFSFQGQGQDTWVGAVQAIGGLAVALTPAVSATVDYRYLHGFNVTNQNDYANHTVFVGLRYTFGSPPAPPMTPIVAPAVVPPVAAPAQPASYLVFFDFDKATLTPDGRQVVNEAAGRARQAGAGVQRLQVNGHTDLAGTAEYNLKLSERRAETVKRALIEQGIPGDSIVTHAYGESNPLVPTAQGVREPQNRRVEILF